MSSTTYRVATSNSVTSNETSTISSSKSTSQDPEASFAFAEVAGAVEV